MSLIVSETGAYQRAPEGIHVARCVQVIDLGTQLSDFDGKSKRLRKVRISWELPDEKTVFDEEKGEEPFLVSKEYTMTLGTKSNLRHDIESWRGKGLTGSEAEAFNLVVLLGKTCMVNVIHEVSRQNRKYAKIINVTPLPKGIQAPVQILPSLQYSIEDGLGGAFEELPGYIQNKILASDELSKRPSLEEITERNVRKATANAVNASYKAELEAEAAETNAHAQLGAGPSNEPEW
jgi:hypothetical protein